MQEFRALSSTVIQMNEEKVSRNVLTQSLINMNISVHTHFSHFVPTTFSMKIVHYLIHEASGPEGRRTRMFWVKIMDGWLNHISN